MARVLYVIVFDAEGFQESVLYLFQAVRQCHAAERFMIKSFILNSFAAILSVVMSLSCHLVLLLMSF